VRGNSPFDWGVHRHALRPRNPIARNPAAPILPSVQDLLSIGAQPTLRFSEGTLLLEGMPRDALAGLFEGMDARWDGRVPAWRTDALNYRPLAHRLRGVCPNAQDLVPQWTKVAFAPSLPAPWPEQAAAIEAWLKTRKGVVVMPTGTGKTEVALHLMAQLGESALVVAPIRDLMYQWHRRILAGLGCDAGIIGDSAFDVRAVSVTTYDSAYIHMAGLGNRFRLLVFDECHHLPGRLRQDAALMCAALRTASA
jgi:hypothetical protein